VSSTPPTHRDGRDHTADLDLVARARSGDADALERLAERLSCVCAMLRDRHRRLGNPLSPEDLAEVEQETLMALWDKLATFAGRASLETWVYRFMVLELHKGLDRRRRQRYFMAEGESWLSNRAQPEPSEPEIDPIVLHEGLERVGSPGADVIRMRHFDELSFDEIAHHLGEPANTVKARYYRGLERLRILLGPLLRRETR
jgi:RNA polymerase sigma-70 factor (ECF subfamily)